MSVLTRFADLLGGRADVERTLLDSAGVAAWRWDPATGQLECNDSALAALGRSADTAPVSLNALAACAAALDSGRLAQRLDAVRSSGTAEEIEFRVQDSTGAMHWRTLLLMPSTDGALVGVLSDPLGSAGAGRAGSGAVRTAQLLEAAPSLLYVYDSALQQLTYVNRAVRPMLGYSAAELTRWVPGHFMELVHPEDRVHATELRRRALAADDGQVLIGRYRLRRADGSYIRIESREVVLTRDVDGTPSRFAGSVIDATATVAQEERLGETEAHLRTVADRMREVIATHDSEGRVVWISPSITGFAGVPTDALIGRGLVELAHPEDRQRLRAAFDPQARTADRRVSWRLLGADGAYRDVSTEVGAGDLSERLPVWSRTADASPQREIEARTLELESLRSTSDLLGRALLELNDLLTVVGNHAAEMEDEFVAIGAVPEGLRAIQSAITQAATVTRTLQGLGTGRTVRPHPVDVHRVVSGFARAITRIIGAELTLETRLESVVGAAQYDERELEQVLTTLAQLAGESTRAGGLVRLRTERRLLQLPRTHAHGVIPAGEYVVVSVEDTGRGMQVPELAKAFEVTAGVRSARTGGALARVRQSVELSGGAVTMHSEPGRGTTVGLWLRAAAAQVTAQAVQRLTTTPRSTAAVGERGRDEAVHILLVDNEADVLATTRRVLESAGYRVSAAPGAPQALDLLDELDEPDLPALVLSDVIMGAMGGRELGQAIAARYPAIRVAYVSGFAGGDPTAPQMLGLDPFLNKPYGAAELLRFVRYALPTRPTGRGNPA